MRQLFIALYIFILFGGYAEASTCGPNQTIQEPNLRSLIETSARSYGRSSSKENVLLQALLRDVSYFKKIFPKNDPGVVGGFYFNVLCRTLVKDSKGGKVDKLGLDKLAYVAQAFQNPPGTAKVLVNIASAGLENRASKAANSAAGATPNLSEAFGNNTAKQKPKKKNGASLAKAGDAAVKPKKPEVTPPSPKPKPGAVKDKLRETPSPAADNGPASGGSNTVGNLPAVVPLQLPSGANFAQAASQAGGAESAQSGETPSVDEQTPEAGNAAVLPSVQEETTVEQAELAVSDVPDAEAQPEEKPAENDVETEADVAVDVKPQIEVVNAPSCVVLGVSDQRGCANYETVVETLKDVKVEYEFPQRMQPGKKYRFSMVLLPTDAEGWTLLRTGGVSRAGDQSGRGHVTRAQLSGEEFEIEPKGPQTRVLNSFSAIRWTWFVTPSEDSKGAVNLDFGAAVNAGGKLLPPIKIKSFVTDIPVAKFWWDPLVSLFKKFDAVFLLAVFAGLAGMGALAVRRLLKQREINTPMTQALGAPIRGRSLEHDFPVVPDDEDEDELEHGQMFLVHDGNRGR